MLGPNGSGKTTLLSLICGDHPQAYSNEVRVFGRRRGGGESIWDIKRRIGLVSPEMHLYFTEPLTADRAAATGFFDVLVSRPTTPEQDATVAELFAHFGIADLAAGRSGGFPPASSGSCFWFGPGQGPAAADPRRAVSGAGRGHRDRARTWIDDHRALTAQCCSSPITRQSCRGTVPTRRLRLLDGRVTPVSGLTQTGG